MGSGDRNIWAVTNDGMTRWRYTTPMPVVASAHCTDDAVYIGDRNGTLYKVLDSFCWGGGGLLISSVIYSSPNCLQFCVVQFNLDGSVAWRFGTNGEIWGTPRTAREELVVFGSMDRHLYCLNDTDGSVLWSYDAQQEIAGTPLIQVVVFFDSPSRVCLWEEIKNLTISSTGRVYCVRHT